MFASGDDHNPLAPGYGGPEAVGGPQGAGDAEGAGRAGRAGYASDSHTAPAMDAGYSADAPVAGAGFSGQDVADDAGRAR
jgi:hypothetical protein